MRDAVEFMKALVRNGLTPDEARNAAILVIQGEEHRHPPYPCTVSSVLGRVACTITAALDDAGALRLVRGEPPAQP